MASLAQKKLSHYFNLWYNISRNKVAYFILTSGLTFILIKGGAFFMASLFDSVKNVFNDNPSAQTDQQVYGPPAPVYGPPAPTQTTQTTTSSNPLNLVQQALPQPSFSSPVDRAIASFQTPSTIPAQTTSSQAQGTQQASSPTAASGLTASFGGASASPSATTQTSQQNVINNAQTAANTAADAERARIQGLQDQFSAGVTKSFDPIFSALDRQIGVEQSELNAANTAGIQSGTREEQISRQFNTDLAGLENVRNTAVAGLGGLLSGAQENLQNAYSGLESQAGLAREQANRQTKANLRDVDLATQNLTTSGLRRLGAAGDSSAAIAISRALGQENLRQRGKLLGIRDDVLAGIESTVLNGRMSLQEKFNTIKFGIQEKQSEVQNVFAQNKSKLEGWKQEQLNNLVNVAQERIAQLQQQRAQASQEQQSQILNLQIQTEQQLMNRLSQLDDEVRNLSTGLDQWALQRQAGLEDYANQLAQAAQYSGGTSISAPNLQFKTVPIGSNGQEMSLVFNPQNGVLTNPLTGYIVDPNTGQEYDPVTGLPKPQVGLANTQEDVGFVKKLAGGLGDLLGL